MIKELDIPHLLFPEPPSPLSQLHLLPPPLLFIFLLLLLSLILIVLFLFLYLLTPPAVSHSCFFFSSLPYNFLVLFLPLLSVFLFFLFSTFCSTCSPFPSTSFLKQSCVMQEKKKKNYHNTISQSTWVMQKKSENIFNRMMRKLKAFFLCVFENNIIMLARKNSTIFYCGTIFPLATRRRNLVCWQTEFIVILCRNFSFLFFLLPDRLLFNNDRECDGTPGRGFWTSGSKEHQAWNIN